MFVLGWLASVRARRVFSLCVALVCACSTRDHAAGTAERASTPHSPDPVASPAPAPVEATVEPVVVPVERVSNQAAREAHQAALERLDVPSLAAHPLVHYEPLENARALESFYRALHDLRTQADPHHKLRILVYGSSSVATDRYTGYLRAYLQHRFGDGGPGFVALVPLWRWHRHEEVALSGRGWTIEHALRKSGRLDGLYGLLGASASANRQGARLELKLKKEPPATRVEVWALGQPGGGHVEIGSDHGPKRVLDTGRPALEPLYHVLDEGPHTRVRADVAGDGEVRLFGAVLERDGKGVVVDELGIGGTEAGDHLMWHEDIWRDNVRRRAPALYVLAYGANAAGKDDLPMEQYRDELARVLVRFRETLPLAACLLIGPADFFSKGDDGTWNVEPRVDPVLAIQRELAVRHDCAFWDTRAFMGGRGAMASWVEAGLARPDHLHFSTLGYHHMGASLADALMAPFDGALHEDVPPAEPAATH